MTRVYIQQNCISHYRKALFEMLSSNTELEFTFIADSISDTPFMKVVKWDTSSIRRRYAKTRLLNVPLIPTLFWQAGAISIVVRDRPNLVIALGNPYSLTAWALLVIGRLFKIPILLWGHGLLARESGVKWLIRKLFYKLSAGLLLYGDHAKNLLIEEGFSPDALHVVYNSLDYDQHAHILEDISSLTVREFRDSLGLKDQDRLVVFTGRLQYEKRLDLLLHAIADIGKREHYIHVVLIGDGSERDSLLALGDKLNIRHLIHFLGAQYDERLIGSAFLASELCVVPSNAGLSIIHAMSFGTPVIIHDQTQLHGPEWEAVIEGTTGFFYKFEDVCDLGVQIEQALFPSSCREKLSKACRTLIKDRYNPNTQVKIMVDLAKRAARGSN